MIENIIADTSTMDLTICTQVFDEAYGLTTMENHKISFQIDGNQAGTTAIFMKVLKALNETKNPKARVSYLIETPSADINKNIYKELVDQEGFLYGNLSDYIFSIKEKKTTNLRSINESDH